MLIRLPVIIAQMMGGLMMMMILAMMISRMMMMLFVAFMISRMMTMLFVAFSFGGGVLHGEPKLLAIRMIVVAPEHFLPCLLL